MGFTPSSKGKPVYNDTADPQADLQASVDYAERIGGLLKVTAAERSALTGSQVEPGWLISETDTGSVYVSTAGSPKGVRIAGESGLRNVTPAGGLTGTIQYERSGRTVEVRGDLSGTFPVGNTLVGNLSEFRPVGTVGRGVAYLLGFVGAVTVGTGGDLIVTNQTGASRTAAVFTAVYLAG